MRQRLTAFPYSAYCQAACRRVVRIEVARAVSAAPIVPAVHIVMVGQLAGPGLLDSTLERPLATLMVTATAPVEQGTIAASVLAL